MRSAVIDSSSLRAIAHLNLTTELSLFFDIVYVPRQVQIELNRKHKFRHRLNKLYDTRIFRRCQVANRSNVLLLMPQLDEGEAEGITQAQEKALDRIILDEKKARAVAANVGTYLKDWLYKSGYGPSDIPQEKWTSPSASFSFRFPVENHFMFVERRGASIMVWTQTELISGRAKLLPNQLNKLTETVKIKTAQLNFDYWDRETAQNRWTIWTTIRIRDGMEDNFLETARHLHSAALAIEQTINKELGN